jgi:hypothetical protein
MKLPSWFGTSKKTEGLASSTELAARLKDAEAAEQAAKARVDEASERLAVERSADALDAVDEAELSARRVARMRKILQGDYEAAVARERAEHLDRVRARRTEARAKRAEHVEREASITAAAARALVEGWVTLHLERLAELVDAGALDREIRGMSAELGETEPDFVITAKPSTFALAAAVEALATEVPAHALQLLWGLAHAVEPAAHLHAARMKSIETSRQMGEERRVESLTKPPPPKPELVRIGEIGRPREQNGMVRQIQNLLSGGDAA